MSGLILIQTVLYDMVFLKKIFIKKVSTEDRKQIVKSNQACRLNISLEVEFWTTIKHPDKRYNPFDDFSLIAYDTIYICSLSVFIDVLCQI